MKHGSEPRGAQGALPDRHPAGHLSLQEIDRALAAGRLSPAERWLLFTACAPRGWRSATRAAARSRSFRESRPVLSGALREQGAGPRETPRRAAPGEQTFDSPGVWLASRPEVTTRHVRRASRSAWSRGRRAARRSSIGGDSAPMVLRWRASRRRADPPRRRARSAGRGAGGGPARRAAVRAAGPDRRADAYAALVEDNKAFRQRLERERTRVVEAERVNVAQALLEAADDLERARRGEHGRGRRRRGAAEPGGRRRLSLASLHKRIARWARSGSRSRGSASIRTWRRRSTRSPWRTQSRTVSCCTRSARDIASVSGSFAPRGSGSGAWRGRSIRERPHRRRAPRGNRFSAHRSFVPGHLPRGEGMRRIIRRSIGITFIAALIACSQDGRAATEPQRPAAAPAGPSGAPLFRDAAQQTAPQQAEARCPRRARSRRSSRRSGGRTSRRRPS